jgi:hypothetical protein
MSDRLLDTSIALWKETVSKTRLEHPFSLIAGGIDFSAADAELGTDDFSLLMQTYAELVGIDLKEYGRKLVGPTKRDDILKSQVGIAYRTVFEVEGHYVEIPTAFTLYKVPTRFLIIVGAVLIGIGTGKAAQIHALLGGAVGGAASLLINILADRYVRPVDQNSLTWREEFVIKFLKTDDELSVTDLHKQTRLYKTALRKTLDSLVNKRLIKQRKVMVGTKSIKMYSLKK